MYIQVIKCKTYFFSLKGSNKKFKLAKEFTHLAMINVIWKVQYSNMN